MQDAHTAALHWVTLVTLVVGLIEEGNRTRSFGYADRIDAMYIQ